MITKVAFENFKLLRNCDFSLGPLSVIVGANGVGKSTALEALSLLSRTIEELASPSDGRVAQARLTDLWSGTAGLESVFWKRGPASLAIMADIGASNRVRFEARLAASNSPQFRLRYDGSLGGEEWSWASPLDLGKQVATKVKDADFRRSALLRLDALRLGDAHYSPDRQPQLAFDGDGLASVLQRLQIARDGRFEVIERAVAQVIPFVKRIRTTQELVTVVEQVPVRIEGEATLVPHRRQHVGAGFQVEWGDVGWVGSRHLSEGTLLVIGLVTLLHSTPPSLILIDDLDKGLHPSAQMEVVRVLKQFVADNPSVQVLATTHSPFVVDALDPSEVLVAGSTNTDTTIRSLADHPSWSKRKGYLQTGEFWSAVGESWVAEKKE